MTIAAFAISILALVASVASAWYARAQARAATTATNLARAPEYTAQITDVNGDGGFYRLDMVLTSSEPMDRVTVRLPERAAVRFTSSQSGVTPGGDPLLAESYDGEVVPGRTMSWRVGLDPENHVEEIRLQVESHREQVSWASQVPATVPYVGQILY